MPYRDSENQSSPMPSGRSTNHFNLSYAWIVRVFLLAAAYFITGKLGIFLAITPGYATAIWPPSGIAMTAHSPVGMNPEKYKVIKQTNSVGQLLSKES